MNAAVSFPVPKLYRAVIRTAHDHFFCVLDDLGDVGDVLVGQVAD